MNGDPFIGLRPFHEDEPNLFFGREVEADVLFDLVYPNPLTLVYSPSGVGKSSLLQAGLVHRLRDDDAFAVAYLDSWRPPILEQIGELIRECFPSELDASCWSDAMEAFVDNTQRCPVLILDQFEEALRYDDELDAVWDQLALLGNRPESGARVLISIRKDYLADLDEVTSRVPQLIENGLHLGPMSPEALRQAFFEPLRRLEPPFGANDQLFEELLRDLSQPGPSGRPGRAEPGYFQVVCQRLWQLDLDRPDRELSLDTYKKEGRARGMLDSYVQTRLRKALSEDQIQVLYAIARYLVTPTGAKVPMTVDDLAGLVRAEDFTPHARTKFAITTGADEKPLDDIPSLQKLAKEVLETLCDGEVLILRRDNYRGRLEYKLFHDLLGPILNDWRQRMQSESLQMLERDARQVLKLRLSAEQSLDEASSSVSEGDDGERRQGVRQLGDVLLQSSLLGEDDPLKLRAEERLHEIRAHDERSVRLEAGRALGRAAMIHEVAPLSGRAVAMGVLSSALLSGGSVFGLAFGTSAALGQWTRLDAPLRGAPTIALWTVCVLWTGVYVMESLNDRLFTGMSNALRAPFEPYRQGFGTFEKSSGWPLNYLFSIIPTVVLASVGTLYLASFTVWFMAFLLLFTIIGVRSYDAAVILY
jgi:hypothetical protein